MALGLKKQAKSRSLNLRVVPNRTTSLSSAQVIYNRLTQSPNCEFVVTRINDRLALAITRQVQDINAYGQRDFNRPGRDSRVGMLPPKLAQIMLNLAQVSSEDTVLDPFCGSGVVLQEALLLGAKVIGSDLSPRMVEMSRLNLDWLQSIDPSIDKSTAVLEVGDATSYHWQQPFNKVVSEILLGPPLTNPPDQTYLLKISSSVNYLLLKTLRNLHTQLAQNQMMVLAVPCWKTRTEKDYFLPVVDQIEEIGYNRVSFELVDSGNLVYQREGQFVKRQLLVLKRK
jgi:tRNA (guanine10-N2)-dimethyltransferase